MKRLSGAPPRSFPAGGAHRCRGVLERGAKKDAKKNPVNCQMIKINCQLTGEKFLPAERALFGLLRAQNI
jgi:hypothetical protein